MSLSRDAECPAKTGMTDTNLLEQDLYIIKKIVQQRIQPQKCTPIKYPNISPPKSLQVQIEPTWVWFIEAFQGGAVLVCHILLFFLWELIGYCYFKIFSCSTLALSKIIMLLVIFRLVSQCFMFISVSHHLWSFQSTFHSSLIITWSHFDLR